MKAFKLKTQLLFDLLIGSAFGFIQFQFKIALLAWL